MVVRMRWAAGSGMCLPVQGSAVRTRGDALGGLYLSLGRGRHLAPGTRRRRYVHCRLRSRNQARVAHLACSLPSAHWSGPSNRQLSRLHSMPACLLCHCSLTNHSAFPRSNWIDHRAQPQHSQNLTSVVAASCSVNRSRLDSCANRVRCHLTSS